MGTQGQGLHDIVHVGLRTGISRDVPISAGPSACDWSSGFAWGRQLTPAAHPQGRGRACGHCPGGDGKWIHVESPALP